MGLSHLQAHMAAEAQRRRQEEQAQQQQQQQATSPQLDQPPAEQAQELGQTPTPQQPQQQQQEQEQAQQQREQHPQQASAGQVQQASSQESGSSAQTELQLASFKRLRHTVNARDLYRRTPLIVAAKQGHLECAHLLVDAASNMFAVDREGNT